MGSIKSLKRKRGRRKSGKIDTLLGEKLKNTKWGEYKIGDLFDIENTWKYGKNKNWNKRYTSKVKNSLPVISGITTNNGVNYYTTDTPEINDIFQDNLTISTRGEYSGTVTYHPGKFVLANNILVMDMPKLTKNQKLFIGSLINCLNYGGYSGYPRKETLKNDTIKLPIKNDEIDFEFINEFVAELEAQRVAELEAYLSVTGLKNYELTQKEKQALETLEKVKWGEFEIQEIFNVNSTKKKFDKNKVTVFENGIYPYVVRTSLNNGISGYLTENIEYLNDNNTISFGQDTATMFYQKNKYFTGDKIKIMSFKNGILNENLGLFFISSMDKSFKTFSWGASSFSEETINSQIMKLPTINSEIDYEFMENIISAIKKLVIKDVVDWTDKKINATKEVIKNS